MEISELRSRKFLKPSDGDRGIVDRLSELPDDILIHILSFLPTKIYVATSILGRRWRFLWARVPNLDFDVEELFCCDDDDDDARVSSIINRVMFLHKRQTINTFRLLHFQNWVNIDNDFEKWMTTAIECNVQQLHLSLDCETMLPICIFCCKTLVNLTLAGLNMPTIVTVCLPALKKLQIDDVPFESVDCFQHLLSGCPVLNELFITNGTCVTEVLEEENNKTLFCISSPTLNSLHLEAIMWTEGYFTSVMLDTPALKYLKLDDYVPYFSHEILSDDFSQIPYFAVFAPTTTFHNITELDLVSDWRLIPKFLDKANNLQVLTIRMRYGQNNSTHWIDPKQVPACLVSHLGTVRIRWFWCTVQEFKAVRYILKNAKVLKRMEIYNKPSRRIDIDLKNQLEALKRISWFKRGSDACRLVFH